MRWEQCVVEQRYNAVQEVLGGMPVVAVAWCPVCQFAIRARMGDWQLPNPVPGGSALLGPATHVVVLPELIPTFVLVYDAVTGRYTMHNAYPFMFAADHDSWRCPPRRSRPGGPRWSGSPSAGTAACSPTTG